MKRTSVHRSTNKTQLLVLFAAMCFAAIATGQAQEIPYGVNPHTTYPSAGISGGYQSNLHSAAFRQLPGTLSCCPEFQSGSGNAFNAGAFFQLPVSSIVALQLKSSYALLSGTLRQRETQWVSGDNGAQPVSMLIEHRIASEVSAVGIEPTAIVFPFGFPLSLKFGASVSYVLSHTFSQEEVLVSPSYLTFENGDVVRNDTAGSIPSAQTVAFGIVAGIGYDLPLSSRLTITPELLYTQSLSNVSHDVAWKINTMRASVAITYPFIPVPEPSRPEIIPIKPVPAIEITIPPPPPPAFVAELDVEGVFKDHSIKKDVTVTVEEMEFRETLPLLPNIFFQPGSSDITLSRLELLTTDRAEQFTESALSADIFDFYAHTLNIIGKRLTQNPQATITCTGVISPTSVDKDNITLATERATVVKEYLVNTWKIAPDRMRIRTRRTTKGITATDPVDTPDVEEENRRVEIASEEYEILKPVLIKKNSYAISPEILRITPSITAQAGVKDWELLATQGSTSLKTDQGTGKPNYTDWKLSAQEFDKRDGTVNISMQLHDLVNQQLSLEHVVPFEFLSIDDKRRKDQADVRVEKYSLILFLFDNASLDVKNRRILDEVKSRIEPTSKVTVLGFTDRTGTQDYNRALAESRCREVMKYITGNIVEGNIEIKAVGSETLVYANDLPEGRSYSRTVQIIIETPVQ